MIRALQIQRLKNHRQRCIILSAARSISHSTSAQPSTSSSSYLSSYPSPLSPPSPLEPPSRPLYSTTPLPPLAPPLPLDHLTAELPIQDQVKPATLAQKYNSVNEQLAVLNACLSNGDIRRAEEVLKRLGANWGQGSTAEFVGRVVGAQVHAEFLKAYFKDGIARSDGRSFRRNGTTDPLLLAVQKSWLYYEALFPKQPSSSSSSSSSSTTRITNTSASSSGGIPSPVNSNVFAVFLKGLVHIHTTSPDSIQHHGGLLKLSQEIDDSRVSFWDVISDAIWESNSLGGPMSREEVLETLEHELKLEGVTGEQLDAVQSARKNLARKAKEQTLVEELKPTGSKDLPETIGLSTLKTSLGSLTSSNSTNYLRQLALENSSHDAAAQLYIHEMSVLDKLGLGTAAVAGKAKGDSWLQSRIYEWVQALTKKLRDDYPEEGKSSPFSSSSSGSKRKDLKDTDIEDQFMTLLPRDKMALITVTELLRLCSGPLGGSVGEGMKATRAMLHIGKAVEHEYHTSLVKDNRSLKELEKELERVGNWEEKDDGAKLSKQRAIDVLWRKEFEARKERGEDGWEPAWSQNIRSKVGGILAKALMETAKVERTVTTAEGESLTEVQEAFSHSYQYVRGLKLGVFKVNPAVLAKLDKDPLNMTFNPRYLPMIVKPRPWLTWNQGSYFIHKTSLVRTKDSLEQIKHLQQSSDAKNLQKIFEGLDTLGSVPWKINKPVFEIVSQVWNSGESLADIPAPDSMSKPLDVEKPEGYDSDPRAKDTFRRRVRKVLQDRRADHSNRCDVNYKLEIGRAFLNETIYFPHNLDFRGRAYPIPPNLSHIGNDLCRGILTFAEPKPLGERGLRWLKIHLANMTGYDKANFDEREARTMEHLDDIFDSADNPLTGQRWWLKAEEPWQCLATCKELAAALRSPNPLEFMSSLPIHQDGTCNGLQHYAALGGDLEGALQVNLDIGDRPSDVYSGVAKMADEVINRDAAEGNLYAKILQGKITRKVVKQTVMTTVYGVTFIGAKRQIQKQLKERGDIPAEHLYGASLYLGRIVLDSIGSTFKGATDIQTWLHRSARLIAKSIPPQRLSAAMMTEPRSPAKSKAHKAATTVSRIPKEQMTSVIWTTPLGLPVVQPYRKPKKRQVSTALQTVFIVDPSIPAEVDPRAQATAFPPNFIHSLDATHMMMTALACKDKIAFASVHDSYWTHACSVDEMSVILRDTFIDLHSSNVLVKLRDEFLRRYAGHMVPLSKLKGGKTSKSVEKVAAPVEEEESIEEEGDHTLDRESVEWAKNVGALSSKSDSGADDEWQTPITSAAIGSRLVPLEDLLPPIPPKGEFDLRRIRDSLYFFS